MRKYMDDGSLEYGISLVRDESVKQIEKWGFQNVTAFEWLTYTTEELGELAEAIAEHAYRTGTSKKVVHEAIQVATLAIKIAEMYSKGSSDEKTINR